MKLHLLVVSTVCLLFITCTSTKEIAKKNTEITRYSIQLPDSLSKKQTTGIDFFASGTNPANWALEMDFDKNFKFTSSDGTLLSTQAVRPFSETLNATTYKNNTTKGPLTIIVYNSTCNDGAGNQNSGKKTEIILNDKHYKGCGKNLYDYHLNDSWVLENAGNTFLNTTDFAKGLPRIEFNLAEKKLTGTDGCNNISASFEVEGSRIKFAYMATTKMSCKNNIIHKIFAEKMSNHSVDYFFRGGKLYLYLIDDSILIFKKAN